MTVHGAVPDQLQIGKAVYRQVVDQVKTATAAGTLRPGKPLPGVRPLAEELRVNRNTVAKAYAELESQGIIETMAGKGCFIRANRSPLKKEVRRRLLAGKIDDAVMHAHHLQIGRDAAGRCYGFFGRNGAGKTTTINSLLNLTRPTSG